MEGRRKVKRQERGEEGDWREKGGERVFVGSRRGQESRGEGNVKEEWGTIQG